MDGFVADGRAMGVGQGGVVGIKNNEDGFEGAAGKLCCGDYELAWEGEVCYVECGEERGLADDNKINE